MRRRTFIGSVIGTALGAPFVAKAFDTPLSGYTAGLIDHFDRVVWSPPLTSLKFEPNKIKFEFASIEQLRQSLTISAAFVVDKHRTIIGAWWQPVQVDAGFALSMTATIDAHHIGSTFEAVREYCDEYCLPNRTLNRGSDVRRYIDTPPHLTDELIYGILNQVQR